MTVIDASLKLRKLEVITRIALTAELGMFGDNPGMMNYVLYAINGDQNFIMQCEVKDDANIVEHLEAIVKAANHLINRYKNLSINFPEPDSKIDLNMSSKHPVQCVSGA